MNYRERIRDLLHDAGSDGRLVGVHLDPDRPDSFLAGHVGHLGSNGFVLNCIDRNGRDDGLRQIEYRDVRRVHHGTDYLASLQALHESVPLSNAHHDPEFLEAIAEGGHVALTAAKNRGTVVTVRFGTTVRGFVREVEREWAEIELVGEGGRSDGSTLLDLTAVQRVHTGGAAERAAGYLYRERYGLAFSEEHA